MKKNLCFETEEQRGQCYLSTKNDICSMAGLTIRISSFLNRLSIEFVENGTDSINRCCEYQTIDPSPISPSCANRRPLLMTSFALVSISQFLHFARLQRPHIPESSPLYNKLGEHPMREFYSCDWSFIS